MNRDRDLLKRALAFFPWGTQTNAKRYDPYFGDAMPAFIERAQGCRMQSPDGRSFIDYRCALGPIILGYQYPAVDEAVRRQMEKGVVFSMASPLEADLASRLIEHMPGIEQVRFLKSGHAANAAALRLARAFTGRERIITCGYHGHSDWFSVGKGEAPIWPERDGNGVPATLDPLVTRIGYGHLDQLEEAFDSAIAPAALIMTPYDALAALDQPFVARARQLTSAAGALLIFDEVLTGFRLGFKGAAGHLGITPDLTTYAKALANGYPLAAFGGRREVMGMLSQVMITATYAGETLSLAAACATLDEMLQVPVHDAIWNAGAKLQAGFDQRAESLGLEARSAGLPPLPRFHFASTAAEDQRLRRVFQKALLDQGIFPHHPFLLSFSHTDEVIEETLEAFGPALARVEAALSG